MHTLGRHKISNCTFNEAAHALSAAAVVIRGFVLDGRCTFQRESNTLDIEIATAERPIYVVTVADMSSNTLFDTMPSISLMRFKELCGPQTCRLHDT